MAYAILHKRTQLIYSSKEEAQAYIDSELDNDDYVIVNYENKAEEEGSQDE